MPDPGFFVVTLPTGIGVLIPIERVAAAEVLIERRRDSTRDRRGRVREPDPRRLLQILDALGVPEGVGRLKETLVAVFAIGEFRRPVGRD